MDFGADTDLLEALVRSIQDCIAPCVGRIDYGNLRSRHWPGDERNPVSNLALVYETPGGSTDQINISLPHGTTLFCLVDAEAGEVQTSSIEEVVAAIQERVQAIPRRRQESLQAEIRRQIDAGSNHAGLFGHLNRMLQSDLMGGSITHLEMRDAMTFAVRYMKEKTGGPPES